MSKRKSDVTEYKLVPEELAYLKNNLWEKGMVLSHPWAVETQRMFYIPNAAPKAGREYALREIYSSDVYDSPDDEWQKVWSKIAGFLAKTGTYQRSASGLEAWLRFAGQPMVNQSAGLDAWTGIADKLKSEKLTSGMLAIRGENLGSFTAPGITVVLDKSKITPAMARLMDQIEFGLRLTTEGTHVVQEEEGKWLLYKAIYAPAVYTASGRKAFGINWRMWEKGPVDDNESRRIWAEQAGVMIKMCYSPALDSVFFDEYVVCDAVQKLSSVDHKKLLEASSEQLGTTISDILQKPTFN